MTVVLPLRSLNAVCMQVGTYLCKPAEASPVGPHDSHVKIEEEGFVSDSMLDN